MTRSILITGCSSGIGLDAAEGLAKRGWRVLATCRQAEDAAALEARGLESYALDHADPDSVAAGAAEALERTGGALDAVFLNGAFALPAFSADVPRDAYRAIFEANVFGPFDLINCLLPAFRKRKAGRIVLNSSVLGFVALKGRGPYVASKFAMEGLTDVYRLENDIPGLHFVLIEPGPVTSMIRQKAQGHFERWIDWEASPRRKAYEEVLMPRLYNTDGKKDRFELPASAVTKKLVHALESNRPHPRYYVTTPTYMMNIARRLLPTRALDAVLRKG